jgi:hypothetical protein
MAAANRRTAKESANCADKGRKADAKKPATLPGGLFDDDFIGSGRSGQIHCRLVLHLVAVLRLRGGFLDGLACNVGTADVETFFDAAMLGFVFVTDTFGHVFLLY